MEKPSRLFVPLAVTASLISAGNAKAIEADENGPLPYPVAFCGELRNAKGPNVNIYDTTTLSLPDDIGMRMRIEAIRKEIRIVMEDDQEVILSCTYSDTFSPGVTVPESFPRYLYAPGKAMNFTATTPNATYIDSSMSGFPNHVTFNKSPLKKPLIDAYLNETRDQFLPYDSSACVEGEAQDICTELGVGLDDFDAAIVAGRKALAITPEEEIVDDE